MIPSTISVMSSISAIRRSPSFVIGQPGRRQCARGGVARFVGAALAAAVISGCGGSAKYSESDIEYKLAALAGEDLTDTSIDRYAAALDRAERSCTEDRERLADFAYAGAGLAADAGVDTTTLELVDAMAAAVPADLAPVACQDVIASVLTLMTGG